LVAGELVVCANAIVADMSSAMLSDKVLFMGSGNRGKETAPHVKGRENLSVGIQAN
jgi:hypothetical protein